jgi:hypothetical protein
MARALARAKIFPHVAHSMDWSNLRGKRFGAILALTFRSFALGNFPGKPVTTA